MGAYELLKQKLELEYCTFRRKLLLESKEMILESAYRAEHMKSICEASVRLAKDWPEEVMQSLIVVPGVLEYLYACWIKAEDSRDFEICRCIKKASAKVARSYRETVLGEKAA